MASDDSRTITTRLTIRFRNEVFNSLLKETRVGIVEPKAIMHTESDFVGPFSANWLYYSVLAQSGAIKPGRTPMPYRVDAVSVDSYTQEVYGTKWITLDNLYDFRAWNTAKQALIVASGATYGGKCDIIGVNGAHEILTSYRYSDQWFNEAVHLVPMLPGIVIGCDLDTSSGMQVEVEFLPKDIYANRGDGSVADMTGEDMYKRALGM